jgi:tRNA-uridine 2-sulfurtransferase
VSVSSRRELTVTPGHTKPRVAVAMSGGVDSSVVAALLLERGYDVGGVTMRLWREPSQADDPDGDAISAARSVCQYLGIPHDVLDFSAVFRREIVTYFVQEYARGRTPNPCVRCNRILKFGLLLEQTRHLGYDRLATGHYARVGRVSESYSLFCGVDARKDQSYVLYALQQPQLASLILPLGEYTKVEVRALAARLMLPVAQRPESQETCFIRDNDYRRFLREQSPQAIQPGPILDRRGKYLGEHKGLPFYTVGQREGLGIAAPSPLYVICLDVTHNALVVGFAEELGCSTLLAEEMSYIVGYEPLPGLAVEAKIRYRARRVAAQVWSLAERRARVVLAQPLRDITPGQAVVLYQGDQVLGGGTISETLETEASAT